MWSKQARDKSLVSRKRKTGKGYQKEKRTRFLQEAMGAAKSRGDKKGAMDFGLAMKQEGLKYGR